VTQRGISLHSQATSIGVENADGAPTQTTPFDGERSPSLPRWRGHSTSVALARKNPNQAWSIDFAADQLQDGRRFLALTAVDGFTREGAAIEVGQRLKRHDVVRTLNQLKTTRGVPNCCSAITEASSPARARLTALSLNQSQPTTNPTFGTEMLGPSTKRYTNIPFGTKDRLVTPTT
jgi:transposase InsO family protein